MRAALGIAACVGTAALAVSGCGGSSSTIDPVAQAATVSNNARGFQMSLSMRITTGALPAPIIGTGSGSFSPGSRLGQVTIAMQVPGSSALNQVFGSGGLTVGEILDGHVIYLKLPAVVTSRLPGQKPWLKIDLSQLGSVSGVSGLGSLVNNPTSSNPAQMLQYLRAESGGVTKVGAATIAGIPTTEYQATIQLDRYPNLLPAAQRAAARQAIQQLETFTKLRSIPMTVWIDNQHLVRQLALNFSDSSSSAGQIGVAMTIQFTHYGPQPAPTLPSADQVGDLGALLAQTQGGSATGTTP